MINLSLNSKSKESIEKSTGIKFDLLVRMDALSIDREIEKKIKKRLFFNYGERDKRLPARGAVFLSLRKYIKMSDVDEKLSKI